MAKQTKQRRAVLRIAAIVAVLIGTHYLGLLRPIERLIVRALAPLGRYSLTTIRDNDQQAADDTTRRLEGLEQRVAKLSVENVALRQSLEAAQSFNAQLTFLQNRKLSGIQARMFARSPDSMLEYILVDAGKRRGVGLGLPVIIENGIIIGSVTAVDDESSRVLLTTDNRSTFAGVASDNPAAQGSVSGVRGLSLRMDLIPQSETLREGQIVVTSGLDTNIPPGLVLGEIDRVEKQPGAVLQSASLGPLFSPARLDAVTILVPSSP